MKSGKDEEGDRDMEVIHSERSLQNIPPTYSPSLVFIHGIEYCEQTFATLTDEHNHIRSVPEMSQMRCLASSYGWLIMQNRNNSSQCYLFNPISLKKIHLPPLRHSNFVVGALTSSPVDNNCVVLLASTKRNSFVSCQIGDEDWIEKDLGPKTKRKSYKRNLFTRILSCSENIYLFCEDGMYVIDLHNLTTKFHKRIWSEVSLKFSDSAFVKRVSFKHFFVESCGDIFHVILIYCKLLNKRILPTLEVFRMEVSSMAWVQVKSLDDRIFLLGATSSVSFSSTEFGMKGNCIYFWTTNKYTKVSIHDMDNRSQTVTLPCPKHLSCLDGPFWVLPNCKLQMKKEAAKLEEVKYVQDVENNLPIELLEIILSEEAFLSDCIRFRLICKSRIHVMPPFRPYTSLIQTKSGCNQLPWLLSLPKNEKGLCNLYHPVYSDTYTLNIPHEFAGAVVRCAKYGWLLMSQGENSLFFFNPSSKETIQLPEYFDYYEFVNITFSSTPTSPDCVVFVHVVVGIIDIYRRGADEDLWLHCRIKKGSGFSPVLSSPVFCDGVFYSLGKEGKLGVLNPNDQDHNTMFKILPNAFPGKVGSSSETRSFKRFLMDYDGEILSVIAGHSILSVIAGHSSAKPVWVYKFDRSKMEWIKLESLGDKVIFLSHTGSIVVPAVLKGVENRVYFPRFQGRDIVYYSLSTGTYHCFGGTIAAEDWINTYQDFNCTWFHPIQNRQDGTKRDEESMRQDQKRCSGFWGYYKCLFLCFFAATAIIASSYC